MNLTGPDYELEASFIRHAGIESSDNSAAAPWFINPMPMNLSGFLKAVRYRFYFAVFIAERHYRIIPIVTLRHIHSQWKADPI